MCSSQAILAVFPGDGVCQHFNWINEVFFDLYEQCCFTLLHQRTPKVIGVAAVDLGQDSSTDSTLTVTY